MSFWTISIQYIPANLVHRTFKYGPLYEYNVANFNLVLKQKYIITKVNNPLIFNCLEYKVGTLF